MSVSRPNRSPRESLDRLLVGLLLGFADPSPRSRGRLFDNQALRVPNPGTPSFHSKGAIMNTQHRKYLLTTPRGLAALHRVHPAVTVSVAAIRTTTDCAFLDAHLAHRLHGWTALLARAANEVVLDCQPRQAGKKVAARVETAAPRSLASLSSALKAVRAGYSGLPTRAGGGSASRLSTASEGLLALRKAHPGVALQGPDGFISSETMYRDAAMARELEAAILKLYAAAAVVYQECHCRNGKPSMTALAALEGSLAPVREWSWERVPQTPNRPNSPQGKATPKPAGLGHRESLAPANGLDRTAA